MNNETVIAILIALVSSFAGVIFEKIITPYIPDRKKLSSYIKKFFSFIVLYALPIIVIIWFFRRTGPIDKYFVLAIAFNFFALSIHVSHLVYRLSMSNLTEFGREVIEAHKVHFRQTDVVSNLIDIVTSQTSQIKQLHNDIQSLKKER